VTVLSADIPTTLGGPSWLNERQATATQQFAVAAMPSTEEEIWRYSRIDDLDVSRYHAASTAPGPVDSAELARLRALDPSAIVVTIDGAVAHLEVLAPKGLRVVDLSVDAAGEGDGLSVYGDDAFGWLNDSSMRAPLVIAAARGALIERPVIVVHVVSSALGLVSPRVTIRGGEASQLTVLEQFVSGDVDALVVPLTEVLADTAANVRHISLQQLGRSVWSIGRIESVGQRDSSTMLASVAFGGGYARTRIDARLVGQGASGQQIAVYFGDGDQMHDFRTLQDHQAPKTTSDLLFKGAVGGRAQSVYTGMIRVAHDAKGTAAYQTNRNLKLSADAWAESVPNLDIQTNDVKCSHASAVGPIDTDQLFYLESRGVPTDVAERLIVMGFFDEVMARLPMAELVPLLHNQVADKLAGVSI
jgi:Fe-S cluster assembly protein SufD